MRQAKKVKPRTFGKANKKKPKPGTTIIVKGRAARHLVPAMNGEKPPPARPTAYSHRHYLRPTGWGASVVIGGLILGGTHQRIAVTIAVAVVYAAGIFLATRHRKATRRWAEAAAACTALWLPLIASFGRVPLVLYLFCWAGLFGWWAHIWKIRPEQPQMEALPSSDELTWAALCEHKRWRMRSPGKLGPPETIPNGRRYQLRLDGIHTHIGNLMTEPLAVAAAFHKPITEAYVEPSPDGVASRGSLTILKQGTLQQVRYWDGQGVTADGFAVVGRFADGASARIRLFAPMDGGRHSLIAGATGSGKSELLNLLLHLYLTCGFIFPIVLDPQEGQSLPDWQGHVPYAAGPDECMEMLELVHALMYSRSRRLSKMTYDAGEGHQRKMSFFDHELTGWPYVRILAEEAHVLLTGDGLGRAGARLSALAVALFKDMGKLGRKTGTAVDLVTQVPSLEELQSQVLRSMLRAGNVICLRTADSVSGSMVGLPADPSKLPQYFPNGDYTYGLGYVIGPDHRQAIARTDITTAEQRRRVYSLPVLERESQAILDRFGTVPLLTPDIDMSAAHGGSLGWAGQLAAVPAPDDTPAPGGQTATDAILAVLTRDMDRDELLERVAQQAGDWGRKPWSVRAVTGPLKTLVDEGRIARKPKPGSSRDDQNFLYSPAPRPVIALAERNGHV